MAFLEKNEKYLVWIMIGAVVLLIGLAIFVVVDSLPPKQFAILTGRPGGGYYQTAEEYREIADKLGFQLEIIPTSGSVEALELLEQGVAPIGFVQGGVATGANPLILTSMASVYYEPVWIFYRQEVAGGQPLEDIHLLEGFRIAIGEDGSGTQNLARQLLDLNGISETNSTLLPLGSEAATEAIQAGDVDALFMIVGNSSDFIPQLMRDEDLSLMSVSRAEAYRSHFPFLTSVTVSEGAINLPDNLPGEDKTLLATAANLIVRNDFHPDLLRLMTIAAVETHSPGGFFEVRNEFPNFDYVDLPVNRQELAYAERIKSGESSLDNRLPFWLAALIDRYMLFILPFAIFLIPLLARSPLLYHIYYRRKITRRYKNVRQLEYKVPEMSKAEIEQMLEHLEALELELQTEVEVPQNYMSEFYELREHIDLVQRRLDDQLAAHKGDGVSGSVSQKSA